jgi:1-acyl-sn-glycerol-3-phosphate acyltransferase
MLSALDEGRVCGIFPGGGRSPDGLVQPPNEGVGTLALRSGAPVVPVTIAGADRAWPPGRRLPRPAPIQLHFGQPLVAQSIAPPGLSPPEKRRRVTREVMLRVADGFAALGRPLEAQRSRQRLQRL